jgi:indolepyruvate ferredoxin oxidoreductase
MTSSSTFPAASAGELAAANAGELARRLSPANAELAVQLASLPDVVRGYEDVKLRNVDAYHQSLADLRAELAASAVQG